MKLFCENILKISIYFLILTSYFSPMFAQAPDTLWTRTYGGLKSEDGYSVLETSDGGFILLGYTRSFGAGGADVYLIKTDSNGNILWTRTYGGRYNDYGRSIKKVLFGGGYIIAGHTTSFGAGRHDVYLIRIDDNGDTLWTRTYGGSDWDIAYSVEPTLDGEFIVAGKTYSFGAGLFDVYLLKIDENGDTLWTRTFGGTGDDVGYEVQVDPYTTPFGYPGYVIVGSMYLLENLTSNIYVIKTYFDGDTQWTRTYGGICAEGYSLIVTPVQSYAIYIITGTVSTSEFPSFGRSDAFIFIVGSTSGYPGWFKTYGMEDVWDEGENEGFSIDKTSDNGYVVAGWTSCYDSNYNYIEGVYVFRTDRDGNLIWEEIIEGPGINFGYDIQQTSDGGYIIIGRAESWPTVVDVYLIRLASEVSVAETTDSYAARLHVTVFPNPFSNKTDIRYVILDNGPSDLKIYDITGRVVKDFSEQLSVIGDQSSVVWDGRDDFGKKVPIGTYLLKFTAGDYTETKKLILLRWK